MSNIAQGLFKLPIYTVYTIYTVAIDLRYIVRSQQHQTVANFESCILILDKFASEPACVFLVVQVMLQSSTWYLCSCRLSLFWNEVIAISSVLCRTIILVYSLKRCQRDVLTCALIIIILYLYIYATFDKVLFSSWSRVQQ